MHYTYYDGAALYYLGGLLHFMLMGMASLDAANICTGVHGGMDSGDLLIVSGWTNTRFLMHLWSFDGIRTCRLEQVWKRCFGRGMAGKGVREGTSGADVDTSRGDDGPRFCEVGFGHCICAVDMVCGWMCDSL